MQEDKTDTEEHRIENKGLHVPKTKQYFVKCAQLPPSDTKMERVNTQIEERQLTT